MDDFSNLNNLGKKDGRISQGVRTVDKFPYEIPRDQFRYGDANGKWKKPGANDISIDCIDGKGISFYSICFPQLCFRKLQ